MSGVTLAFVGGGNLARALVEGAIASGQPGLSASDLAVAEPDPQKREAFTRQGVRAVASAPDLSPLAGPATQLLLAVKPQSLDTAAREVGPLAQGRIVISVLAGTPSARVAAALGGGVRIVRAMPNTPARVRQAATALALGEGARPGDDALAERLFTGVGPVVVRLPESLLDAFTAVAASGPAYVFYLAEAMVRAAIEVGLPPQEADRAVRQTIAGAAALLTADAQSPQDLRAAVTSKGGTTQAAVAVLDERRVMSAVMEAISAARDRGNELGRQT